MLAEIKEGKNKNSKRTNSDVTKLYTLTKVCNSMTMTSKEKRSANTNIEISQHALVTFKFLTEFVAFCL